MEKLISTTYENSQYIIRADRYGQFLIYEGDEVIDSSTSEEGAKKLLNNYIKRCKELEAEMRNREQEYNLQYGEQVLKYI